MSVVIYVCIINGFPDVIMNVFLNFSVSNFRLTFDMNYIKKKLKIRSGLHLIYSLNNWYFINQTFKNENVFKKKEKKKFRKTL